MSMAWETRTLKLGMMQDCPPEVRALFGHGFHPSEHLAANDKGQVV